MCFLTSIMLQIYAQIVKWEYICNFQTVPKEAQCKKPIASQSCWCFAQSGRVLLWFWLRQCNLDRQLPVQQRRSWRGHQERHLPQHLSECPQRTQWKASRARAGPRTGLAECAARWPGAGAGRGAVDQSGTLLFFSRVMFYYFFKN